MSKCVHDTEDFLDAINSGSIPCQECLIESLHRRLEQTMEEIHKHWGAVPVFCEECNDLTEGDAEVCHNGHSML